MSTVLTCVDCSTRYAIGLDACPHCGSSNIAEEGGASTQRLPLFVTTSCTGCGRGPWTVRLKSSHSGLLELPTLACASCGSQVPLPWPPEEEPMSPKITAHGGATNARADADVSPAADASESLVGAEADQGRPTPEAEPTLDEVQSETAPDSDDVQESTESEEDTSDKYAGLTLGELRNEATTRDIPAYGTKTQIADRLRDDDAKSSGGDGG